MRLYRAMKNNDIILNKNLKIKEKNKYNTRIRNYQ